MKDFHIQLEKLQVEAEDCALISKLASNVAKRVAFARLADQFRTMAANMEAANRRQAERGLVPVAGNPR